MKVLIIDNIVNEVKSNSNEDLISKMYEQQSDSCRLIETLDKKRDVTDIDLFLAGCISDGLKIAADENFCKYDIVFSNVVVPNYADDKAPKRGNGEFFAARLLAVQNTNVVLLTSTMIDDVAVGVNEAMRRSFPNGKPNYIKLECIPIEYGKRKGDISNLEWYISNIVIDSILYAQQQDQSSLCKRL